MTVELTSMTYPSNLQLLPPAAYHVFLQPYSSSFALECFAKLLYSPCPTGLLFTCHHETLHHCYHHALSIYQA
jgi:hypothetical protein